jgi:hypothetical protein
MNRRQPSGPPEHDAREATRVLVCTATGNFEGNFHHAPGVRLSDAIRNSFAADHHVLLTDVVMEKNNPISASVSRAPFVLINDRHANVIVPIDERMAEEESAAAEGRVPVRLLRSVAAG